MKDRIRLIIEKEGLTPSEFADKLQIGRAVISHILNGRNNPSLDVVTRILGVMNYINPEWLLSAKGTMYKSENNRNVSDLDIHREELNSSQPDLFSVSSIKPSQGTNAIVDNKETVVDNAQKEVEQIIKQQVIYQKTPDRKISKIIIYYTDNTFETFNADNRPL